MRRVILGYEPVRYDVITKVYHEIVNNKNYYFAIVDGKKIAISPKDYENRFSYIGN